MPAGKRRYPSGIDFHDIPLSIKELKFVAGICEKGFGKVEECYREAGFPVSPNRNQVRAAALRLLEKPEVHQAIKRFTDSTLEPYKERMRARIMEFLEIRAFWNPKDYFDTKHEVKSLHEISDEALLAVDGVKVDYKGKDADRKVVNFDMANRSDAVKSLQKFLEEKDNGGITLPEEHVAKVKSKIASVRDAAARGAQVKRVTRETTETISFPEEQAAQEESGETQSQGS